MNEEAPAKIKNATLYQKRYVKDDSDNNEDEPVSFFWWDFINVKN